MAQATPESGAGHRPGTPSLSIIIVTHNSAESLPGLIDSLHAYPPGCPWELIVVDNASRDRSIALLHDGIPDAVVIVSPQNRGFAAAVNTGARAARGECLLLANPDVTWCDNAIDRLKDLLGKHPRAAAVAPRLLYPDGRPQPSIRRFPTHANIWFSRRSPWGPAAAVRRSPWSYTLTDPPSPSVIEAVAATFLCVRTSAFREVGGMDEGYFLYVEDTDLCRRWHDAGWEVWSDPAVTVRHVWQSRVMPDPMLARHHRDGIRRYFRRHHPKKRLRNAAVFTALALAAGWDRLARSSPGRAGGS
ncbi:MAG: glycosyltransferase family 2 protein [Candidatus Zixiibacteriota bacterium]